jgi:dephospho-CoA kinase
MTHAASGRAIGITGGFGCGKSEVGRILARHGVPVLDADDIAREQLSPGSPVLEQVLRRFGADLAGPDGRLDRRALGRRVFGRRDEIEALNALVHAPVLSRIRAWLTEMQAAHSAVAVIVPLLYEAGVTEGWDAVICVAAPAALAAERLKAKGWSDQEIRERTAAQMPIEEKVKRATKVIYNDGTLEELEQATMKTWNDVVRKER